MDLTAGRGIAVREFQMKTGFGFADWILLGLPFYWLSFRRSTADHE